MLGKFGHFSLVARQPSMIMILNFLTLFKDGDYNVVSTICVLHLFFQIYNIENVENKHFFCL